jgi:cytochrome P450
MIDVAALSAAVPKPAHVPDAVLFDFDMFRDPAYVADPHSRIIDLVRRAPPVFWTPRNGGHWMFLSHAANFKAARDTDPPEHGRYRTPLQRAFSPKMMLALKDDIRALANQLIDLVIDRGRCDFMSDIAEPLPVRLFLKLLGLPLERQEEYRAIVKDQLADAEPDAKKSMLNLQRITAMMRETMLDRRERPQDDLISLLWQSEIDGRQTTLDDMENYGVVLFIAGLDTVMNGMGFGIRHLAQDIGLQDRLRANPQLIPEAFTIPPRRVGRDTIFEGMPMKEGERVMLFLPAADLDPQEFPDSDRVDLLREKKPQIAFNAGPHRCLGSHLARIELQTLYEEVLLRLPQFRLDPDRPVKFHSGHVIGVDTLPLVWGV